MDPETSDMLMAAGETPTPAKNAGGRWHCPVCGEAYSTPGGAGECAHFYRSEEWVHSYLYGQPI